MLAYLLRTIASSLRTMSLPRYTDRPFPTYRFVPGQSPHPRRDPQGHSYGQPEPTPPLFTPEEWWDSEWYLYGIDLYNHGYWWECHEVFEGLWHAVGPDSPQGQFLQALIQVAAAIKAPVKQPLQYRASKADGNEDDRQRGEERHPGVATKRDAEEAAHHRERAVGQVDEIHQAHRHRQP